MRPHMFLAAALLAAVSGARAEIVDIRWSGDGRFMHRGTLAAGKFVEVCGMLPARTEVRWGFESGASLDFNVHYHVGKEVVFPSMLTAVAAARDILVTEIEQHYCWKWSNKSAAPVALAVNLLRR